MRLDLFTRWSGGLHLPWAHVLAAGLPAGGHVMTLRVAAPAADAPQRRAVRIAHFLVSGGG